MVKLQCEITFARANYLYSRRKNFYTVRSATFLFHYRALEHDAWLSTLHRLVWFDSNLEWKKWCPWGGALAQHGGCFFCSFRTCNLQASGGKSTYSLPRDTVHSLVQTVEVARCDQSRTCTFQTKDADHWKVELICSDDCGTIHLTIMFFWNTYGREEKEFLWEGFGNLPLKL